MVCPVDLVAVTEEEPPPLQRQNRRSGVDFRCESIQEDIAQVKVVVALEVDQAAAAPLQGQKGIQHGVELLEGLGRKSQPEIEQVAHDEEGFRVSFQVTQKTE